jgi:hypothetical protein
LNLEEEVTGDGEKCKYNFGRETSREEEDLGVDRRIILKWILELHCGKMTELNCLKVGFCDGLLCAPLRTFVSATFSFNRWAYCTIADLLLNRGR